jgi:hypothetical protein
MENNNNNQPTPLKDKVLEQIREHHITMRSGGYFALQTTAIICALVAILFLTIFICNYILFSLRIDDHFKYLHQGPSGFVTFGRTFPWLYLVADLALMLALQQLLKRFRFGYQIPVGIIFSAIIILALAVSLVLDRGVHLNDRLVEHAHRNELPPGFNHLYDRPMRSEAPILYHH